MLHSMFKDIQTLYFTFCPLRSAEIFWKIRKYDGFRFIYSKRFNDLDPILIYNSRCMTSLLKLKNNRMFFFLAFIASLFMVTEEDRISETDLSGPLSFF